MSRATKTVCSHDCPDACSVLVTVDGSPDEPTVQFRGDPDHPFTRGFLCGKVSSYERVVQSPNRVLYPLRRKGPKGVAVFERISWDDAIEAIAARLRETGTTHGGESILQYSYGGTMGLVHRYSGDALFHLLGATRLRPNICSSGADEGYRLVVGSGYGVDPKNVVHSDLVIVWGANIVSTQVHLLPFINRARKRGAKLVVIDPYRNRTARMADHWIPVKPGTDAALALGMIHIIERDGMLNRDFIEGRTLGYERLSREVLPKFAPENTAAITGIPAHVVEDLARNFAGAQAPLIKVGIGLGRSSQGATSVRAICCLAGTVGSYERPGGGVLFDSGCEFKVNLNAVTRPDWLERPTRRLNMTDIAVALTEWEAPPIKFLYVHGSNPAATAPLQNQLLRGLERQDLFTVVHERFVTDTARYADILLPAVTFAESADLYKSYGHLYLQYGRQAMKPLGECRANLEVFQAIGKALGYDDPWFDRPVEEFARELLATDHPNFRGIDPERVLAGETVRLSLPRLESGFADRFATASGKLEFVSEELERQGLPALPDHGGDPFNTRPDAFRLRLLTPPAHAFLNSSFGADARSRRKEGGSPMVMIHPDDACDIRTGDEVELFNEHGEVRLVAQVTTDTQPGTVVAEGTWWPTHGHKGRGINALTSNRLTDLGGGSTFHDNRVALRKTGSAYEAPQKT